MYCPPESGNIEPSSAKAKQAQSEIRAPKTHTSRNNTGCGRGPAMSFAVRKMDDPMIPLTSSSTESSRPSPRTSVGFCPSDSELTGGSTAKTGTGSIIQFRVRRGTIFMPDKPQTPDGKLQQEFNRWAAEGEGPKMERHHLDITEKTIRLMNLRPGERVLDMGCGSGWATRLLARLVGDGPEGFVQVVGLDVSDEMVRQAREASRDFENILYVWGSAMQIPWEENFFDKVLCVESFYYYPDQDRALTELFRVMAPRRNLFILINLYRHNVSSLRWVDKLKVPVHVRSAAEYVDLLKKHAFENV